jgi:hypothetical protein
MESYEEDQWIEPDISFTKEQECYPTATFSSCIIDIVLFLFFSYFLPQGVMEGILPRLRVQSSTASSITLSWDEAEGPPCDEDKDIFRPRYTIHIKDRLQGWIPAYWYVIFSYEITLYW